MKRYVLFLGLLLCCILLKAQSVNYTCRYWFDQNHAQAVTTYFSESTWQAELDVGSLLEGVHQFHLQIADTTNKWSPPRNYLFFKLSDTLQNDWTCHYWFDQNHQQMQHHPFGNGHLLLEVANLEEGMHTMSLVLESENLTAVQNYTFVKVATIGLDTLNMSHLVYHCWFDQDFDHQQTDSLGDGHILLDVDGLTNGLHTVNVMLESSVVSVPATYMFMKVAVQDSAAEVQYHCWFDNDYSTMQTGFVGNGIFELEVGDLSNGLHTVNIQLDNGLQSTPQCYLFYKRPVGGLISKWEYWLNGEINNRHTSNLIPGVDTLSIITLLPVETRPIRSTCFHFQPNGEEPYINAKNEITLRFWDADNHFFDKMALYVDENVSETIIADTLERNTTVSIDAPRDNQIHWFKMEVGRGDYLSFKADKACAMQLFAPSGEEVYTASGPESIELRGFNVWEDGTYYLAVHDVMGSGETVSVTYNWLNRYSIVSYDVHLVGNGGCSTITFQGNGFNSLLDAYLVNWQNDTIRSLDIGHESNTTTTVSLNFYQENLGAYDAVFEFYEETIRINGALEVQEPVDIQLTSTVSYPSVFLRNTPCTYTYTITNNGNMSAYAVPIYVYVSSQTKDGISHLEIDGLDLPSVIDDIDLDSLSANDRIWLQEWAEEIGEDHYFMKVYTIDEETGDSVYVRTNFFFMTIAPFETKTIAIKVTANELINVFVTVPNDVVQPLTFHQNRGFRDQYCCVHERASCLIQLVCGVVSLVSEVSNLAPGTPVWVISSMLDCICGIIEDIDQKLSDSYCQGDDAGFWSSVSKAFNSLKNMKSITKAVAHCVTSFLPSGSVRTVAKIADIIYNGTNTVQNCYNAFNKSPDCPPGPPRGGGSTPVNSLDPNDIHGYLSESGSHYMRQEIQNVHYEIEFENDTTLATAAAHTIIVRDTLDASKFDLNSLAARSVTIGDKRLELNGEQTFARTLDLRPEIYVIAQIEQDYDPTTGIVEWTIQSLDPMTMEPTDDPNQGVLPVNYFGDGVGFIDYSINLREAFDDGTEISNRAGIIFDQEDIIMTPIWTNIVDAVKPTSHIENVVVENDSLNFSFVSSDSRSGVWYHSLYYRNDSTEMEWLVKKAQIFENSYNLRFDEYQTTEYLVMAVDSAGNVEAMKTEAEVVVESSNSVFPFFVAGYGESANAGWKFIASPIAGSIAATTVGNIFSATQYDLYDFDQGEESEWRNYKSNSFNLTNGQGYLYATKEDKTLIFRGTYNEADAFEMSLVYTGANPHTDMRGWNLIGNPFTVPAYVDRSYYTMNEEGTAIEPVAVSEGSPIPACHGVMVKAEASDETVTFSRTAQQNAPSQGNIQIIVAQATTRGNTKHDKAIVSFSPSDQLGKFNFNESNAKVYISQDGKDYAIAYAAKTGEVPVSFKAAKNGTYTINVDAEGMEFYYLHLIDNLTGNDVDLLALRQAQGPMGYTFEARTTDYASRFILRFIPKDDASTGSASDNFAYCFNGTWIIANEGDATLQVVDIMGRVLSSERISGCGEKHIQAAAGVYVLHLMDGNNVRTQKIVVQ